MIKQASNARKHLRKFLTADPGRFAGGTALSGPLALLAVQRERLAVLRSRQHDRSPQAAATADQSTRPGPSGDVTGSAGHRRGYSKRNCRPKGARREDGNGIFDDQGVAARGPVRSADGGPAGRDDRRRVGRRRAAAGLGRRGRGGRAAAVRDTGGADAGATSFRPANRVSQARRCARPAGTTWPPPHLPRHGVQAVERELLPVDIQPAYDRHRDLLKLQRGISTRANAYAVNRDASELRRSPAEATSLGSAWPDACHLYVRARGHPGGTSHGQPRTPSAKSPDLRKPAGRPSTQTLPACVNQRRAHRRRSPQSRLTGVRCAMSSGGPRANPQ
jgi:hypothetical protein